jgi:hypothetical protein
LAAAKNPVTTDGGFVTKNFKNSQLYKMLP